MARAPAERTLRITSAPPVKRAAGAAGKCLGKRSYSSLPRQQKLSTDPPAYLFRASFSWREQNNRERKDPADLPRARGRALFKREWGVNRKASVSVLGLGAFGILSILFRRKGAGPEFRPDQTLLCLSCSHARRPEDLSCPGLDKKGLRIPNPVGPDGLVCPSLANRIPAQRHCLCAPSPYRSRSVFSTAGEAVVEAKPIAKPTIKYEIGPLLKDLMEWPSPPKSAYVIWELIA
ncbi:hypothetical protein QYF36_021733 [Acer negundo]|nr:hypothetical protein QYF36_021733 [Acer negundo]